MPGAHGDEPDAVIRAGVSPHPDTDVHDRGLGGEWCNPVNTSGVDPAISTKADNWLISWCHQ